MLNERVADHVSVMNCDSAHNPAHALRRARAGLQGLAARAGDLFRVATRRVPATSAWSHSLMPRGVNLREVRLGGRDITDSGMPDGCLELGDAGHAGGAGTILYLTTMPAPVPGGCTPSSCARPKLVAATVVSPNRMVSVVNTGTSTARRQRPCKCRSRRSRCPRDSSRGRAPRPPPDRPEQGG